MAYACCALLLIAVQLVGLGRPSGLGRCPKHKYMQDFNITKFTGRWYEIERSFYLMELTSACIEIDLSENDRGQIDVSVSTIGRWSGSATVSRGVATTSKRHPSIFLFKVSTTLPNTVARFLPGAGFYQILDTDYEDFAVLWTCTSLGLAHTDLVWILGRSRELNVTTRANIYDYLLLRHIDSERLILSSNNCTLE
ncbi:PREDICTED: apolipoprotein D-like [Nicrophorus vespilloides]|uniref:Apolipoprotein D-like n=1 Tax=Nicrophorus vespilloides TaxID=110193 RepID=A0ABM1M450_NICVS|nr:PREDICTED: apolipoprotein D-like [Nicrophorus vespilloides]